MLETIAHRGPDGGDLRQFGSCAIGTVRLAILDPRPRADQPMSFGSKHLVYNGELYNFRELRKELEAGGVVFRTEGDTEVVLHALHRWGRQACSRFRGMFALALWDDATEELWLARDRYGIKPLFWTVLADGTLAAASETRALCELSPRPIRAKAVREFLQSGSVLSESIAQGVLELPPGSVLVWRSQETRRHSYARTAPTDNYPAIDPVERLQAATIEHLVSDRPVAIFLSGGFDSTALLAAARHAGHDLIGLTLSTGRNRDDVDVACRSATHYGIEHHVVELRPEEVPAKVEAFVRAMDQPTIDGFNVFVMSEAARERGCPVVLTGLGGDEVLGGYGYYRREAMLSRLAPVWQAAPRMLQAATVRTLVHRTGSSPARIRAILSARTVPERFRGFRTLFGDDEIAGVVPPQPEDHLPERWLMPEEPARQQFAALDFDSYLRPTLLRDADLFTMCHGVEGRVPFLDWLFVESVLAAPHPPTKAEIARAWGDTYLEGIVHQRKRTFRIPWEDWLAAVAPSADEVDQATYRLGSSVDVTRLDALLAKEHLSRGDPLRSWALVVLIRWLAAHTTSEAHVVSGRHLLQA